ncbi:hypothetical protein MMC10_010818 [Thelotrema lepadinum]|nr:hypothetical protein [Thelotrema lepadinum]
MGKVLERRDYGVGVEENAGGTNDSVFGKGRVEGNEGEWYEGGWRFVSKEEGEEDIVENEKMMGKEEVETKGTVSEEAVEEEKREKVVDQKAFEDFLNTNESGIELFKETVVDVAAKAETLRKDFEETKTDMSERIDKVKKDINEHIRQAEEYAGQTRVMVRNLVKRKIREEKCGGNVDKNEESSNDSSKSSIAEVEWRVDVIAKMVGDKIEALEGVVGELKKKFDEEFGQATIGPAVKTKATALRDDIARLEEGIDDFCWQHSVKDAGKMSKDDDENMKMLQKDVEKMKTDLETKVRQETKRMSKVDVMTGKIETILTKLEIDLPKQRKSLETLKEDLDKTKEGIERKVLDAAERLWTQHNGAATLHPKKEEDGKEQDGQLGKWLERLNSDDIQRYLKTLEENFERIKAAGDQEFNSRVEDISCDIIDKLQDSDQDSEMKTCLSKIEEAFKNTSAHRNRMLSQGVFQKLQSTSSEDTHDRQPGNTDSDYTKECLETIEEGLTKVDAARHRDLIDRIRELVSTTILEDSQHAKPVKDADKKEDCSSSLALSQSPTSAGSEKKSKLGVIDIFFLLILSLLVISMFVCYLAFKLAEGDREDAYKRTHLEFKTNESIRHDSFQWAVMQVGRHSAGG